MPDRRFLTAVILTLCLAGCARDLAPSTAFQTSTIGALLDGEYDGDRTFGELRREGDFGLGTFDAVDGEMVAVEGRFYQVRTDGRATLVSDSAKTPFSVVTHFRARQMVRLAAPMKYADLKKRLDEVVEPGDGIRAVRIDGVFSRVLTRSVPRQQRPYRRLAEVVKDQTTFEFHNVGGTMVGFRFPASLGEINVPGYHFHFLTADRKAGGHLLDCESGDVVVRSMPISILHVRFPERASISAPTTQPTENRTTDLQKVEQ